MQLLGVSGYDVQQRRDDNTMVGACDSQRLEALGSDASEPSDEREGELGVQELKNGVKN